MADEKKVPAAVVQAPPPAEKSPEQKAAEAKAAEQAKPKGRRKPPWETVPGGRYIVDPVYDEDGKLVESESRVVNAHGKDPDAKDNGPDPSTHPALLAGK